MQRIVWTDRMINTAISLRAEGAGARRIGQVLGINKTTVSEYIARHPGLFQPMDEPKVDRVRRSIIGDRLVDRISYTTISGAVVSLPRISMIDGPGV